MTRIGFKLETKIRGYAILLSEEGLSPYMSVGIMILVIFIFIRWGGKPLSYTQTLAQKEFEKSTDHE